jgi:hypothetical protein
MSERLVGLVMLIVHVIRKMVVKTDLIAMIMAISYISTNHMSLKTMALV